MSASPIEMPGRSFPVLSLAEAPLPDAVPAQVPSRTARFMAAYAVAEHVTAVSAVEPQEVKAAAHSDWGYVPGTFEWRIGVHVQLDSVEEVRHFADVFDVAVVERDHGGGRSFWFADGVMDEVPFRAWVLADAEVPAVSS
jgi:hypothetical protein